MKSNNLKKKEPKYNKLMVPQKKKSHSSMTEAGTSVSVKDTLLL
jgi:hypothetical protein